MEKCFLDLCYRVYADSSKDRKWVWGLVLVYAGVLFWQSFLFKL